MTTPVPRDDAVRLPGTPATDRTPADVLASARAAAGDPRAALALAGDLGRRLPLPGAGHTAGLWSTLAGVAAADLTVARALEPHLDAVAILEQAGAGTAAGVDLGSLGVDGDSTWGVFAAEGPAGRLEATYDAGGWTLTGTKPWCSLAGVLSHGLVTAWTGAETRRLFAVRLAGPQVRVTDEPWVARGLPGVTSSPVEMERAPAVAVGEDGWYLTRPGFAWGGIGVAAIWYGGAVGVARRLVAQAGRRHPDQIGLAHLGAVDAVLVAAATLLGDAATRVDDGRATGHDGALLALRVRQVVRRAAEEVLDRAHHGLGPGPLVSEPEHAARVADLQLYLRQEHAERDQAALGRQLLTGSDGAPW
jgi:alkylation response protein AidB-like acyl-CoA dehydrogenase